MELTKKPIDLYIHFNELDKGGFTAHYDLPDFLNEKIIIGSGDTLEEAEEDLKQLYKTNQALTYLDKKSEYEDSEFVKVTNIEIKFNCFKKIFLKPATLARVQADPGLRDYFKQFIEREGLQTLS